MLKAQHIMGDSCMLIEWFEKGKTNFSFTKKGLLHAEKQHNLLSVSRHLISQNASTATNYSSNERWTMLRAC